MRKLNDAWFKAIESRTNHFHRINSDTIMLWFSGVEGSDPMYWGTQELLISLGGSIVGGAFDSGCGKCFIKVKEPKNVLIERKLANEQE